MIFRKAGKKAKFSKGWVQGWHLASTRSSHEAVLLLAQMGGLLGLQAMVIQKPC